jgi:hypothetical protein
MAGKSPVNWLSFPPFKKTSYTIHPRISLTQVGLMRAGLAGSGFILLILGLILILFLWPLVGFETQDSFSIDEVEGEETVKYVGEVTDVQESAGFYILELDDGVLQVYTSNEDFEVKDRVVVTIKFGGNISNWDENTYTTERVPTTAGVLGGLFFLVGIGLTVAGLKLKKPKIEELVSFTIHPGLQTPIPEPLEPQGQPMMGHVEHITCPKCQNMFDVQLIQRPMNITCPSCGVEGVLK